MYCTVLYLHGDLPVQAGRLAPRPRAGGGAVAVVGGVAHVRVAVAGGDISLPAGALRRLIIIIFIRVFIINLITVHIRQIGQG